MVCKPCADFTLGLCHPGQVSLCLSLARSCSSRTPQTPLKHYPRADALGKSDATIQLPRRIDITSHHGRPRAVIHVYMHTYIYIYIQIYIYGYTRAYKLESPFRGRVRPGSTDRQAFGFRKGSKADPRKHCRMYIR